jgi:hypothetical protein
LAIEKAPLGCDIIERHDNPSRWFRVELAMSTTSRHRGKLLGFTLFILFLAWNLPSIASFVQRTIWGKTDREASIRLHLALGLIHEGQTVEDLLRKHGPFRIEDAGSYQQIQVHGNYIGQFQGYRLIAKDGKLRSAEWWTDSGPVKEIKYFDTLSAVEWKEFEQLYWKERRRISQARLDSQIAVSSSVLYERIQGIPQPNPKRVARIAVAGTGAYEEPTTWVEQQEPADELP